MEKIRKTIYLYVILLILAMVGPAANAQMTSNKLSPEILQLLAEASSNEEYSKAGAVILLREGKMTLGKNGLYTITGHIIGKILSEKAASDYSQISIYFNSYYREITLEFAHTIRDGKVIEISKDAIQVKSPPERTGIKRYTDRRALTFSMPALDKGVIFEYQVKIKEKKPKIQNRWWVSVNFNHLLRKVSLSYIPRIDPVLKSRFVLKVPEREKFSYQVTNLKLSPTIAREKDHTTYTWETGDLSAVPIEKYMPPIADVVSRIYLSSLRGWEEVDQWASGLFFPKIEITEDIQAKAQEITSGAETEVEKIKALFYFMEKKIEYIQADLSRGGYRPHFAAEILEKRYGCCKDQSILFISMLRALGIPAYPALLKPYSLREENKEIIYPNFNHVIVYIPRTEGDLWLDTTPGLSEFPYLHWRNQGRWALVVDGKGGNYIVTPSDQAESNQGIIKYDITFKNETLFTQMSTEAKGAISDNLKGILKLLPTSDKENIFRDIVKTRYPAAHVQMIDLSDLRNPQVSFKATVLFELEYKDILKKSQETFFYSSSGLNLLSLFTKLQNLTPPEDRKNDYILGFKFKLIEEWLCPPPKDDFRPNILPQDVSLVTQFFSFRAAYTREGELVRARSEFTLEQNRIRLEEYTEFYEGIQDILNKKWLIIFNRQKRAGSCLKPY